MPICFTYLCWEMTLAFFFGLTPPQTSLDFLEIDNPSTWQIDHTSNQLKYTGAMAKVTKADGRVIRCEVNNKQTISLPMPSQQIMAHLINNHE